jgi:hypothetical protein
MPNKKVTYPVNEVIGFCGTTEKMLTKYKTQMIAAKIDPEAKALAAANDVQEGFKTQLRDQTVLVNAANVAAYTDCSNACDMVITAFGRGSSQAQEAINLRKGVRPSPRHDATPAPSPTPAAPAPSPTPTPPPRSFSNAPSSKFKTAAVAMTAAVLLSGWLIKFSSRPALLSGSAPPLSAAAHNPPCGRTTGSA